MEPLLARSVRLEDDGVHVLDRRNFPFEKTWVRCGTVAEVAKAIEEQTSRVPSDIFLWAAVASAGVSLAMQVGGQRHRSLFFGQWVPAFLLLGVYNKIVKVAGSDVKDTAVGR